MRFIKSGLRVKLLSPPNPEDEVNEVQSCRICTRQFGPGDCQKALFLKCNHIICLGCLKCSRGGCGECEENKKTVDNIEIEDDDSKEITHPSRILMPPPPPPQSSSRNSSPGKRTTAVLTSLKNAKEDDTGSEQAENDKTDVSIKDQNQKISLGTDCEDKPEEQEKTATTPGSTQTVKTEPLLSPNSSGKTWLSRCVHCDASFTERKDLGIHYTEKHKALRPFSCETCKWPFASKALLQSHQRRTHNNRHPFKCEVCSFGFDRELILNRHLETVHGVKSPSNTKRRIKREAAVVVKSEPQSSSSASHEGTENNDTLLTTSNHPHLRETNLKKFSCIHCPKIFTMKMNLVLHLRMAHSDIRPHVCNKCGWSSATLGQLRAHLTTHRPDRPHSCKKCGRTFCQRYLLEVHVKLVKNNSCVRARGSLHTENSKIIQRQKSLVCVYCSEIFQRRHQLALHLNHVHSDKNTYPCDICQRPFSSELSLKRHKSRHIPVKIMIKCDICESSFNSKSTKERHMLVSHSVRTRLTDKDKAENTEYCPECRTKFDDEQLVDGCHRKVALSVCGHVCCISCVILDAELGCWQCTSKTRSSGRPSSSASPPKSTKPRKSLRRRAVKHLSCRDIKVEEELHNNLDHDDEDEAKTATATATEAPPAMITRRQLSSQLQLQPPKRGRGRPRKVIGEGESKENTASMASKVRKRKIRKYLAMTLRKRTKIQSFNGKTFVTKVFNVVAVKKWTCRQCKLTFRFFKRFSLHMLQQHGDNRLFQCHQCEWAFPKSNYLQRHMLKHSAVRFKCKFCKKSFSRTDSLGKHVKSVHAGRSRK